VLPVALARLRGGAVGPYVPGTRSAGALLATSARPDCARSPIRCGGSTGVVRELAELGKEPDRCRQNKTDEQAAGDRHVEAKPGALDSEVTRQPTQEWNGWARIKQKAQRY
jgi:hypothetical protein